MVLLSGWPFHPRTCNEASLARKLIHTGKLANITKAAKFYKDVFDFEFKPNKPGYSSTDIQMFDFTPKGIQLSGGFQRVPDESGILKSGGSGICIHWFVKDVEESAALIEKAGGKMLSAAEKEGESGLYRYFEDTEGNTGSVYQMVTGA